MSDALSALVKLYGPGAADAEPAERDGVSGYNCRIATTRIARLVQLERLKDNGLRAEIVSPGKVFVSKP